MNTANVSQIAIGKSARKALVLCLLAAAVVASFFYETAQAQENSYVDLVMLYEYGISGNANEVTYSVRNTGTATATGVTVSFLLKDLEMDSLSVIDIRTDDATKEQRFTWEVGTVLPGKTSINLALDTFNHTGYTGVHPTEGRIGVITVTASSDQPEPDLLLANNVTKVYSWSETSTGASKHMSNNRLGLLLSVDDLRPDDGGDVDFDLTAHNFNPAISAAGSYINIIGDIEIKVELSKGLKFKEGWNPGTTFVKSGSQSATWSPPDTDTKFVANNDPTPRSQEIEIQTQLTSDSLDEIPLEERCITARVVDSIPPPSPDYVFGSLKQCLGDDPLVIFEDNVVDLFTLEATAQNDLELVTKANILEHPQLRSRGLARGDEIDGRNTILKFSPERFIIQVKDSPHTRGFVTDNSVTSMTWQTKGGDATGGVEARENISALVADDSVASTVWTSAKDKLTASGIDGASKPGTLRIFNFTETFKLADADNSGFSAAYDFGGNNGIVTGKVVLHFGELGTYKVGRTYKGTHNTAGEKTTAEETYTFHVGPIAELEVRDGGPAFTSPPTGTH